MTRFLIMTLLIISSLTPAWAGQGWYLMVPRVVNQSEKFLSEWEQYGAYDMAKECQDTLTTEKEKIQRFLDRTRETLEEAEKSHNNANIIDAKRTYDRALAQVRWLDARCIASDDPRLKQK
ncbi:MAG: hypothetical protein ACYDBV_11790 [Nitrospiria bacterium]